ncbi:DUF5994 family protein [Streptomyces sp. WM6378]|uniref:DUF5994 family protein n=1 Tax=Streptomyces sp. WM6378 TaxID=1415557 RepID=UPI000A6D4508|nr:DUF5994 family protein [Streptomyces sp. WM6378]
MTTALDLTVPRDLGAGLAARLSLTPKTPLAGQLDGVWWPYSRGLEAELPPLAAALDEPWGRIPHVTVNPTHWPVIPHKVPVAGHTVHVGWFTEQHPDKLILLCCTVGRWDLLVIPPETEPAAAARLINAAAIPGSILTAGVPDGATKPPSHAASATPRNAKQPGKPKAAPACPPPGPR